MNRKIWKALGIAVCMLALAAPRAMAVTYEVGEDAPFIKFGDAVDKINKSGDKENEIILMQNITLEGEHTLKRNTTIKGKEGEDHTISIKGEKTGITVTGGGTVLNLGANGYDGTLTIDGNTRAAFITVSDGATANMYGNVTLQNKKPTGNACVAIMGSKSVFNMHGGVIEKCSRAVSADSGATFHMFDGEIKDCRVGGNGVILVNGGSGFIMDGGTISGCEAGAGGGLYVVGLTLTIKGGTISECMVSDTGKGGGLFADQSTLTISGGTIKGNKAAYGGGVALRDSRVKEEPITSWTVVDNEAYKTDSGTGYIGGGIYLENGSMDVSDGSNRIYNNTADGHGADICLEGDASSIKLPNAANMGVNYHDSGINIDGWYNDNPRYTPSENGVAVNVDGEEPLKGALSLVASYKAIPVRIEIDANGGEGGSGSQTVHKGTNITLEAPTKEGHLFKGWKDGEKVYREGETLTVTGDMTLTAEWKKLPSAENLPKTGDESPVLLWGAALAVSAAACFMLRRRK